MHRVRFQQAAISRLAVRVSPGLPFRGQASNSSIISSRRGVGQLRRELSSTRAIDSLHTSSSPRTPWSLQPLSRRPQVLSNEVGWKAFASTDAKPTTKQQTEKPHTEKVAEDLEEFAEEDAEFGRSAKASQAAQLNLKAKLSKEGAAGKHLASKEVWRLLKLAGPEMKTLSMAFSLLLISSSVSLSIPWSIGKIMDLANKADGQITLFGLEPTTFYLGFAGLLALGASANFGRVVLLRIVGERIVARTRARLFKQTIVQNAEFFDANRVGDLISRLGVDTTIVGKSITQNLSDGLRALVTGGAGLAMMTWTSPHLTTVLFVMLPPVAVAATFFGRAIRNLSRQVQKALGTLTKIAEERLGNVKTTQAFVSEAPEVGRYSKQVKKIFELGKRDAFLNASFFGTTGFLGNMTILALLYVGGGMVQSGSITVGQLSSFLLYAAFTGSSMFGLSGFYTELMKGSGAASRIFELQDSKPTIYPSVGDPVKSARGQIEFNHVKFSYPTRPAVTIFEDISFRISPGSNVAIVAASGAGKSTVAQLLLRFYAPNSGTISINGKDIATMNAQQLRRKIGYVGQEPVLFSGTIAENIAYGLPHAHRHDIVVAARKANCHFISDFPDGLDTQVGPRGAQLSGGQKQRIAIARALLKNPDILILDEATSALDAESETLVNQALHTLLQSNNTTISIAHRLSTIQRSDRIIVIGSDGAVAEEGSYYDLSRNKTGAFSQLMHWQISGEGPEPAKPAPRPTPEEEIENDLMKDDEEIGEEGQEEEVTRVEKK